MRSSWYLIAFVIPLYIALVRVDAKHGGKSTKLVSHGSYKVASYSSSNSSKSGKGIYYQTDSNEYYSKGKGGKSLKSGKGGYNVYLTSKSAKGSFKGYYQGYITSKSKTSKSYKTGGNYHELDQPFYDSGPPHYGNYPPIYYGSSESAYDYDAHGVPPMLDGVAVGWWFFPDLNAWYFYGHNDPFSSQQSGPYNFDDGSIICFSGGSFPDGVSSTNIHYKYTMTSEGGSLQDKVDAVESEFSRILSESLDCSSRRRLLISTRQLGIVGIDPSPADTVGDTCGTGCNNIDGSMSITMSEEYSQDELCNLTDELVKYADSYESGSIENVSDISMTSIDAGGYNCYERDDVFVPIVSNAEEELQQKNAFPWYYPFVAVVLLLLVSFMLITKRRRSQRYREQFENSRMREIRELEEENRRYAFGAGYNKFDALNSVNVHKCHSASCPSCATPSSTEFVPLANVQKWIQNRTENSLQKIEEEDALDTTLEIDDVNSDGSIPPPPLNEYPDDEYDIHQSILKAKIALKKEEK